MHGRGCDAGTHLNGEARRAGWRGDRADVPALLWIRCDKGRDLFVVLHRPDPASLPPPCTPELVAVGPQMVVGSSVAIVPILPRDPRSDDLCDRPRRAGGRGADGCGNDGGGVGGGGGHCRCPSPELPLLRDQRRDLLLRAQDTGPKGRRCATCRRRAREHNATPSPVRRLIRAHLLVRLGLLLHLLEPIRPTRCEAWRRWAGRLRRRRRRRALSSKCSSPSFLLAPASIRVSMHLPLARGGRVG
mmetsp:Transcript_12702/g.40516  ORF Transcript_12702/g.40516 Transcript_12702/m.40516 type:complete len:245 (-) Transcript_12702:771-1505(-)